MIFFRIKYFSVFVFVFATWGKFKKRKNYNRKKTVPLFQLYRTKQILTQLRDQTAAQFPNQFG